MKELDQYAFELEQCLEAILEEFEPSVDPGEYEIYDAEDNPIQVSSGLAEAITNAEKLLYGTDVPDESDSEPWV